jgi:hypothetical protein
MTLGGRRVEVRRPRLAVVMLDGLEIADRTHVVALGITTEGVKIPLGLWEGSTENATLARTLLADLVDRGLDPEQAILFVIDGAKALRKAVRDVLRHDTPVQRCIRHKECHEAGAPPAAVEGLGDIGIREERRDAAVRRARLGHPTSTLVRGDTGRCGHRRGLDTG